MTKRIAGVMVAIALTVGLVFGQDALSIKPKPKAGSTWKLKVHADVEIMGTTAAFSALETAKVTKVDANGDFSVELSMSDVKVDVGGSVQEQPEEPPTTAKHNASGEIIDLKGEKPTAADYTMGTVSTPIFPKEDVKVGSKWTVETKGMSSLGAAGIKLSYEVLRVEEVLGVKAAVVKFTAKETSGDAPMSASGQYWVDLSNGFVVKGEMDIKQIVMSPELPPMDMKMKMERVK
ncbi:MAG: hypothetical protein KF784_02085 [Fimbriimonadaceae bacterium]|nr:hypothetical protein [Fimbriimonadaceae bacterium]